MMKILQVHNKYKITGGEWTVLEQEFNLLSREHSVEQFIVDNGKELDSLGSKLKLIFSTHYNSSSKELVKQKIRDCKADIMHVHNFFPLLTPSIFEAAREAGIPSVLTLHNYRLIHPNGYMYHNGKVDSRSITGSAYRCILDGVYRDSMFQTAVSAHMIEYHRKHRTWEKYPSVFIALSEFSKKKFVEGGLPAERIFVKPNFMEDPFVKNPALGKAAVKKNQFLYVGRISKEKGVDDLIECWMKNNIKAELLIAGDGPLQSKLERKSESNHYIKWLGKVPRDKILSLLASSGALLFPTKWFEGQPMILLEAMSVGCPVVTSRIGNPKDLIDHEMNGLHFTPGKPDELYTQIRFLQLNDEKREKMGIEARKKFLKSFTPEKNYQQLSDIYRFATEMEGRFSGKI